MSMLLSENNPPWRGVIQPDLCFRLRCLPLLCTSGGLKSHIHYSWNVRAKTTLSVGFQVKMQNV